MELVVKSPPAGAGDVGSNPGVGGSHVLQSNRAHVPQLLSLCSGAQGPQLLSLCSVAQGHAVTEPALWGPGTAAIEPLGLQLPKPKFLRACSGAREATSMRSLHKVTGE